MSKLLALVCLIAGLNAVPASAASAPVVPRNVQAQIARVAPALAYAPTRVGIGFRYRRWEREPGLVRIRFRNRAGWEIAFVASPLRGTCRAGMEKSFQLDGNKVYWGHTASEQQAWRCVTGRGGTLVRLVAASPQPPSRFADVVLGRVVASGKRIS